MVYANAVQSMQAVIRGFDVVRIQIPAHLVQTAEYLASVSTDEAVDLNTGDIVPHIRDAIVALWAEPATKEVVRNSAQFQLNDSGRSRTSSEPPCCQLTLADWLGTQRGSEPTFSSCRARPRDAEPRATARFAPPARTPSETALTFPSPNGAQSPLHTQARCARPHADLTRTLTHRDAMPYARASGSLVGGPTAR